MIVDGIKIGECRTFIIAEIGSNHMQDYETALQTIDAAVRAGADAVKFQSININELYYNPSIETKKLHKIIDLNEEWHYLLKDYCDKQGIIFFSTPTYLKAIDILEDINVSLYKLASAQIGTFPQLVRKVASLQKPTLFSTGIVNSKEIDNIIKIFNEENNPNYAIMHCNSIYPTPYTQVNLDLINTYKSKYNKIIGFSDHTEGIIASITSVLKGAKIIERHFTLNKNLNTPDASFSLNENEFKEMVKSIRIIEQLNNSSNTRNNIEEKEMEFKNNILTRVVLNKSVKRGDIINKTDFKFLRGTTGIDCRDLDKALLESFEYSSNLKENTLLEYKHIKSTCKYSWRQDTVLEAARFLATNFLETGKYQNEKSWGPEGILYLAESSWALLDAYSITKEDIFIDSVKSILKKLKELQKESGGWCIDLYGTGIAFPLTPEQRADTANQEDPPTTSAILKTISMYQSLTNDDTYYEMGKKGFNYLMTLWDPEYGSFIETPDRELLGMRSNPRSYHIFFLLGMASWRCFEEDTVNKIFPSILNFVKETFEMYDSHTMPLVYGLHAATLMDYCSIEYIENIIKPRIDKDLVNNKVFECTTGTGTYGHHDGVRGIVTDEAHMRSAAGIIIAMKKYDIITKSHTYRDSIKYKEIAEWIDNMKDGSSYYEYETLIDNNKQGTGSPGQYLPCFWVFNTI